MMTEFENIPEVTIRRSALTTSKYESLRDASHDPLTFQHRLKQNLNQAFTCSAPKAKRLLFRAVPSIKTFATYKKKYIAGDVMSGLSVGVLHISQGMGFALLAGLPPVYGLYSAFFQALLYFFFGSCHHVSFGPMAYTAILIGDVVNKKGKEMLSTASPLNNTNVSTIVASSAAMTVSPDQIMAATTVTLLAGLIQILLGFVQLGKIAVLFSEPYVDGFMIGGCMLIISTQIKGVFGLTVKTESGLLYLFRIVYDIFDNLEDVNYVTVIVSATSMAIILLVKFGINVRFSHKLKFPIPIELIVIVIAVVVSYFLELKDRYNVAIIGNNPSGFPELTVPKLQDLNSSDAGTYLLDSAIVAFISMCTALSLAKVFANKSGYEVPANQELVAYGVANAVSSFFGGFAGTCAPPRSALHESCGGKTTVAGLISAAIVLLTFMVMGPLLNPLPLCVLNVVVISSLLQLFAQAQHITFYWKISKLDAFVFLGVMLAEVLLDLTTGLLVGLGLVLLTIMIRSMDSRVRFVGLSDGDKGFNSGKTGRVCSNYQILKAPTGLTFTNSAEFKDNVLKILTSQGSEVKSVSSDEEMCGNDQAFRFIILDFSTVSVVDSTACHTLLHLSKAFDKFGTTLVISSCSIEVYKKLRLADVVAAIGEDLFFFTCCDAEAYVQWKSKRTGKPDVVIEATQL